MSKQRFRPAPSGRFKQSPVTADARRGPNLDYNTRDNKLQHAQSVYQKNITSTAAGITQNPFESGYFDEKILGYDLGPVDQSAFDPLNNRDPFNSNIDFEAIRAKKQSTITALGNTGIQFLGKTSVGIVGNLIGGFYGLGTMAFGDGDINALWDNKVYRNLDDFNASVEANNTVFLNRKKGLGWNFELYKDVSDAMSFIAAAAASEVVMQTVGNAIGGSGILTAPGRWSRWIAGLQKMGTKLDDVNELQKMAQELGVTAKKMSQYKQTVDLIKASTGMARKVLTTTGYEAGLEARGVSDEMVASSERTIDELLANDTEMSDAEKEVYKDTYMLKAKRLADSAGLATFGLNTAVLSASNMIQFPTLFGSSYAKAKKFYDLERAGLGQVKKATAGKFQRGLSTMGRILKNPATEFMEETLQGTVAEASKHYYENILDTETNGGVLAPLMQQWASSLQEGLTQAYTTEEGLHEGVIGAIVGAIGLPGFRKKGGNSRFSWQGGVVGSVKDLRKKKQFTETAVDNLNAIKLSDAMVYKKDNAILATLDVDREDYAIAKDDPFEFEAVQDNKVFRFVQERMKKGAEEFIDEDVTELKNMDLATYAKTFQKEEAFTQEEKDTEVEDFANKVDVYKKAYKVAHKTLNFGGYQYDNKVHNELSDILTHAIATEKVYGERLETLKKDLYEANQEAFTHEEIDGFAKTSGKVRAAQAAIDAYIADKTDSPGQILAHQNEIKKQMDPQYTYLLDMGKTALLEQKELLENSEELSEDNTKQLESINKALTLKESYDTVDIKEFNANKSSTVRKNRKSMEELTAEVNEVIKKQVSEAMAHLGEKPKSITQNELEKYMSLRPALSAAINEAHASKFTLDRVEKVEGKDLLSEVAAITERYTTAVEVAASLYDVRRSPGQMYSKLVVSKLFANLDNVARQALEIHFKKMAGDPIPELASVIEEIEFNLPLLKKQFHDVKEYLSKKGLESAERKLDGIENTLIIFADFVEEVEAIEKQKKDSLGTWNTKEQLEADVVGSLPLMTKEDEASTDKEKTQLALEENVNRLSIRETLLTGEKAGQALQSNPGFANLDEAIAEGKIKNKAAATLVFQEDIADPENNAVLMELLKKDGVLEAYKKGWDIIQADPKKLEKPDGSVKVFVKYAPIHINVYDKIATKILNPDGTTKATYDFELEKDDVIVYQQFLFVPDDWSAEDHNTYTEGRKEIEDWAKAERKKHDPDTTYANIKVQENARLSLLKSKYAARNNSITSNMAMRTALLQNAFSGTNELKLKIHNVNQGNFENFKRVDEFGNKQPAKVIEEFNVETLEQFNPDTMEMDRILFTKQDGKYVRIDGTKTAAIPNHFAQDLGTQQSSQIYFGYQTKNGAILPIKMNIAKLTPEDIELMFKVMEKFILAPNKAAFLVNTKEDPITAGENKILSMKKDMDMDDFLSFFLKRKRSKKGSPLFLKNTYSLISKNIPKSKDIGEKESLVQFILHNNDIDQMKFQFPPVDGTDENKKEILAIWEAQKDALWDQLLTQRHNFNRKFFMDAADEELNREALKEAFQTGLINHPFNTETNFDKIFDPNYNKTISLSRTDVEEVASTQTKALTWHKAIQDLRGVLTNKNDKTEISLNDMYYSIENGIRRSLDVKIGHIEKDIKDLSKKEKEDLVKESIETVIDRRIEEIRKTGALFPGKITDYVDHEKDTTLRTSDTALDQLLKSLYFAKNTALKDKMYIKQIVDKMKHWNALKAFRDKFRDQSPLKGANFAMMKWEPNSDKTAVQTAIQSREQLEAMMKTINVLKALLDDPAVKYVDVNYVETFKGTNKLLSHKFIPSKGVGYSKLTNKHHKTRLKSIQIEETPRWDKETGELVAGEVYFNFGRKGKDGVVGNQKVLVLSADTVIETETNIMTSISLPFISVDGNFEVSDQLGIMAEAVSDNIGDDMAARNIALGQFKSVKSVGKMTASDLLYEEETQESLIAGVEDQLEKDGNGDVKYTAFEEVEESNELKDKAVSQLKNMYGTIPIDSIEDHKDLIALDFQTAEEAADVLERYLSQYADDQFNFIEEYGYVNIINDIIKDTTETVAVPDVKPVRTASNRSVTARSLNKKTTTVLFSSMIPYYSEQVGVGVMPDLEVKATLVSQLKKAGINSLQEYLSALEILDKQDLLEVDEYTIQLGEWVFNEKKEDCEGSGFHDNDVPF